MMTKMTKAAIGCNASVPFTSAFLHLIAGVCRVVIAALPSNVNAIAVDDGSSHCHSLHAGLTDVTMAEQDFSKVEELMDGFRRTMVNNSEVDTALPYFVGVESLQNHSINVCLHVRKFP